MDMENYKQFALKTVVEAGKILTDSSEKVHEMAFKGKSDIVTEIDLEVEKMMVSKIVSVYPDHGILSEEKGSKETNCEYVWIMDPIDGTINYYYGSGPYRVALCLLKNKQPILSAIYNPVKDRLYFTELGKGAWLNEKRITVNDNFNISNSVVMTHLSSKKEARARTILALEHIFNKTMHMRMFGSGLSAMSYVASGKFDIFFNVKTNPWDILPGALLIQEAGGLVTDIQGGKLNFESTSVLATNGKVHNDMLKLLENI